MKVQNLCRHGFSPLVDSENTRLFSRFSPNNPDPLPFDEISTFIESFHSAATQALSLPLSPLNSRLFISPAALQLLPNFHDVIPTRVRECLQKRKLSAAVPVLIDPCPALQSYTGEHVLLVQNRFCLSPTSVTISLGDIAAFWNHTGCTNHPLTSSLRE